MHNDTHPLDGTSALDAAIWYAEHWRALVAPADPTTKKPLIKTGKDHAEHSSRDADVIRRWSQWTTPGVRVCVVTGPESGVFVLDGDRKDGIDGVEALRELEERYGPLDDTPRAQTKRGEHIVTRYPNGVALANTASTLAPGVDTRGRGGLFIAPPAPDRRWFADAHPSDVGLMDLPARWIEALAALHRQSRRRAGTDANGTGRIRDGRRNSAICSMLGVMRRRGAGEAEMLVAARVMNKIRCEPPLADDEVAKIVASVLRYPPAPRRLSASNGDLPAITAEAWAALTAANDPPYLFTFGTDLVRLTTADAERPMLTSVTENIMRHELARAADWFRVVLKKDAPPTEVPAPPPVHVCRDLLATADRPLPRLSRIVEAPVFAADGSLDITPGYQLASGTFYAPAPNFMVPAVSPIPTGQDIAEARRLLLEELLGDFPFIGDAERAHAVALLLLPFLRELIDGPTPLFLIEKPAQGTGAGLLADAVLFPALGQPVGTLTEGGNEDEWRKRITAKLLTAPVAILIDNIRARLDSAALSSALTTTVHEDRRLGTNEMVRVPVRTVWLATGNNPGLSGEMSRRVIRIRLDAKVDRPWQRTGFRHPDLRAWASDHRPALVWAALTLGQGWIAAGQPLARVTLGSFEQWAQVTGGVLEIAGIRGFLVNLADFYDESDDEGSAWRALVSAWWDAYKGAEVGTSDLWTLVSPADDDPIDLPLGSGTERSQRTRFGKLLARQRDRQYGGYRITRSGTRQHAQRWKLTEVQP